VAEFEALDIALELSDFVPVTIEAMGKLILSSSNKSNDLDPIPTWLLKHECSSLVPIVSEIICSSLRAGTFPDKLKTALVTPVIKKQYLDRNDLKNYRSVSNLAFISKILEKTVASQLVNHLSYNNLLEPFQSAYRADHSTETALLRVHMT